MTRPEILIVADRQSELSSDTPPSGTSAAGCQKVVGVAVGHEDRHRYALDGDFAGIRRGLACRLAHTVRERRGTDGK